MKIIEFIPQECVCPKNKLPYKMEAYRCGYYVIWWPLAPFALIWNVFSTAYIRGFVEVARMVSEWANKKGKTEGME